MWSYWPMLGLIEARVYENQFRWIVTSNVNVVCSLGGLLGLR